MGLASAATVTVVEMLASDLGLVLINGKAGGKIFFSGIKSETIDTVKRLVIGPAVEAAELTEALTETPSVVNYNNTTYIFFQSGGMLQYATCSGSGWSSTSNVPYQPGTSSSVVTSSAPPTSTDTTQYVYVGVNSAGEATYVEQELSGLVMQNGPSGVVYNDLLYVFYQGSSGGLYFSMFNGTLWSAATLVADAELSYSPSAAVFNYQLYVFHQGGSTNGQLWYSVFNGSSWAADTQVPGVTLSISPTAAMYDDALYVLYQGANTNGQLYYNTFDGSWSSVINTNSSAGISSAPSALVYDSELMVVHEGGGNDGNLYTNCFNGSSWSGDAQMLPIQMSCSPGPAVFNNELYCFWQGAGDNGQLQYSGSDGSSWGMSSAVSGASLSLSPQATVFNNELYCMYQGPGEHGILNYSTGSVESTWSAPAVVSPIDMLISPSAVTVSDTEIYCFYQQNGQLCYTSCDTTTNAWTSPLPATWAPTTQSSQMSAIGLMYTPSVVLFTPTGAPCAQLYIFYQTAANGVSGQLWLVTYDPTTAAFSPPVQVANVSLSYAPGATVFNNELYVFYQGGAGGQGDNSLYYDCLSATGAWAGSQQVPNVGITYSPAPVVYNNQLYVFHQGVLSGQPNNDLYYVSLTSTGDWNGDTQVPGVGISYSPAPVLYNDQLYVFHQGEGGGQPDGLLFYDCLSSTGAWSGDTEVANLSITYSPAVAVCSDKVFALHQGGGGNGQFWFDVLNGSSWAGDTQVNPQVLSASPCAVNFSNVVYSFYNQGGQLWCSANAGGAAIWSPQIQVPGVILSGTPSAVVFNDEIYVFYQGASNNGQLNYVTYNSGTGSWAAPVWINSGDGVLMENSPSAVVFNNALYVFYQGVGVSWCYNVSTNGASWGGQIKASIGGGSDSPSAVVYDDLLYLFYQGGGNSGGLYYNTFNGSNWTSNTQVSPGYMTLSDSPSAVVYNSELYVFAQGSGGSGQLGYCVLSAGSWSVWNQVQNASMSGSPAAVLFNSYALWVLYEGADNNGELCSIAYNGAINWVAQEQAVPSNVSSAGDAVLSCVPVPVVFNNQLYAFYNVWGEGGAIYYTSSPSGSPGTWDAQATVPYASISGSPSPVVFNNKLYIFYQGGSDNSQLWCNIGSIQNAGIAWSSGGTQITVNNYGGSVVQGEQDSVDMERGWSPSAVIFNGNIYCFYPDGNGAVSYVVLNGSDWNVSTISVLPGGADSSTIGFAAQNPIATVYDGQIYVFAQGANNSGQLMYTTSSSGDAGSWSALTQAGVVNAATGGAGWTVLSNQVQALIPPFMTNLMDTGPLAYAPKPNLFG